MSRRAKREKDVRPVSDLGAAAVQLIENARQSGRPLVLTNGEDVAAVVLSAAEYAQLLETIDLLRDVLIGVSELDAGEGIPHEEVKAELLARFAK